MKTNLTVGQPIWFIENNQRRGDNHQLTKSEITSIGNKYFTIDPKYVGRFHIESLEYDGGGYSPRYRLYLSDEDYNIELEKRVLSQKIKAYFSNYNSNEFDIEVLRRVSQIIS